MWSSRLPAEDSWDSATKRSTSREVTCCCAPRGSCRLVRQSFCPQPAGSATVNSIFSHYDVVKASDFAGLKKGKLVSMATGKTNGYGLDFIQERGSLFIGVNEEVYEGMVIGMLLSMTQRATHPLPLTSSLPPSLPPLLRPIDRIGTLRSNRRDVQVAGDGRQPLQDEEAVEHEVHWRGREGELSSSKKNDRRRGMLSSPSCHFSSISHSDALVLSVRLSPTWTSTKC